MVDLNSILMLAILLLPLVGGLLAYMAGNRGGGVTIATVFAAVLGIAVWSFLTIPAGTNLQADWIRLGEYSFAVGLWYDQLTGIMVMVVALIALLVAVFSMEYMKHDESRARYFGLLGLFAFSMYGIVLSSNLLLTFVFWELVGFSSYLLIGFWFDQVKPPLSSFKAFVMNKVGDAGFLLGIFVLYAYFKTLNIAELLVLAEAGLDIPDAMLFMAGLGLFLAAVGKSAQFPLQTWLPDAMTGPTPVSALIHAATMVAAGVYLLVRVFPLLSPDVLQLIGVIGGVTAFTGAFAAFAQNDIKKILAYSTVSQLGYMVMAIGAGFPVAAFFHLVTHAFFKAGLFLCAGSIIHYFHETNHDHDFDAQDIRNMGGLRAVLPITFVTFTICTLSLAGIPLFSGFLSKELVIGGILSSDLPSIVSIFALVSVFMTAAYMGRLYFRVFFGTQVKSRFVENIKMKLPLMVLTALSFWAVFTLNPFGSHNGVTDSLAQIIFNPEMAHYTWLPILSVVLAVSGILVAYLYVEKGMLVKPVSASKKIWGGLSANNFYLDYFHRKIVAGGAMKGASFLFFFDKKILDRLIDLLAKAEVVFAHFVGLIDKHVVDGLVKLLAWTARFAGGRTRKLQSGNVQMYFVWALFGLLIIVYFLT
ncbi:NADH-quinone oxidoreductase subunit L [Reichenbachiella agariperforans]|uniref:NADH-quinone oxidoreductase subunit L n=1 Tax=Reichenbachiella agariperforans TaxID=156994 RepID=A0A1M6QFI5_REIAG|nr:NADH-quinone oxidoreductase subunit L [Reichenbachiella agariperforans]SHK19064.1 NADH-quinone oxidoreductase subunit L [Reichenbachiella agariperforans]